MPYRHCRVRIFEQSAGGSAADRQCLSGTGGMEHLYGDYAGAEKEEGVVPYFSLFKLLRKCGKL